MRMAVVSVLAMTFAGCASATGDPSTSGSDPQALSRDAGADLPPCPAPGIGDGEAAAEGGGKSSTAPGAEPGKACVAKAQECTKQGIDAEMCRAIEKSCDEPPAPSDGCTTVCTKTDGGEMCKSSCPRPQPPSAACTKTCSSDGQQKWCRETCSAPAPGKPGDPGKPGLDDCVAKVFDCLNTEDDASLCKALAEQCKATTADAPVPSEAPAPPS